MITKKGIVFVNDNWGKFDHGGIDVFNQKLCEAMGYVMKREEAVVVCLVIGERAVEDGVIKRARDCNVIVVSYVPEESEPEEDICKNAADKLADNVSGVEFIWIGHDIKSGERACAMAKLWGNNQCAVIMHTDYYRIHADRRDNVIRRKDGEDNAGKANRQRNLAVSANYVFCVGPKMYRKFSWLNRENHEKAFQIIPGLEEHQTENEERNINIMIAGRFYGGAEKQKNWENTCKAIVDALDKLADKGMDVSEFVIVVYGFDPEMSDEDLRELQEIENRKFSTGIRPVIQLKRFDSSRREYLQELGRSAVFVMGSEQESFGMVAWEALALEVPIVISKSSGLYEYLDNELGYLLEGLCGAFPANRKRTIRCMGKSIAGILKDLPKMKKATELLRDKMSINKWENLAITIAKRVGIDAVMDEMIYKDRNCFEFTYAERGLMFEEIKACIVYKKIKNRVLFFGGVSRKLFWQDENLEKLDSSFCDAMVDLLKSKKDLHVYICYETGNALKQREGEMKEEMKEILQLKAEKIKELKKTFQNIYNVKFEGCEERFHLIPLTKSPSVYINILDENWFFSIKYENRTTQNTTVKLRNGADGKGEKERLRAHMKFILNDNKEEMECMALIKRMDEWEEKYRYE